MLKKFNPITPSQRNLIRLTNVNLSNKPLLKNKIKGLKTGSGRNCFGRITSRHKGGGHKQRYRKIDLNRSTNSVGIILSIEYDPNRSANIASIYDLANHKYFYVLASKNIKVGDILKSGSIAEVKNGHSLPLSKIPVGSYIHNVSLQTKGNSKISRAAGTFCELIEKNTHTALIKLCSGELRYVPASCFATIGTVSNDLLFLTTIGKAGRSRWLNKRPKVRGVAMNPVDHPHGGGEGKTSGGKTSVTPWGKPGKGKKTSNSKSRNIVVRRKTNLNL